MAEDRIPASETQGNPVDTEQPERDEAFEADLESRLEETMNDFRATARKLHYAPPPDYSKREQLRRGTHRRLDVLAGYVSIAAKMLEWAATEDLNADRGDPPPLDSVHLETLSRLLSRAAKGMEQTMLNANCIGE